MTTQGLGSYFGGAIVRPRSTFDALAGQPSVRWAMIVALLPVLQVWGNMLLHAAFGLDWLGTRGILADPTFVGGFGHLRIDLANYILVYALLMPLLSLIDLVGMAGSAHLLGKLWRSQATFEQTLNVIAFATVVPNLVIAGTTEWLFGVPIDLLSGHPYWWVAAMNGELGPFVGAVWNAYVFGVYLTLQYGWIIALGALGLSRVQRIPLWGAAGTMVVSFAVWMFVNSMFTR